METRGAEKMSLAAGTGHSPGDLTSIPELRVNVLQVPLEAMALQSFPQLHSALDAGGRKYGDYESQTQGTKTQQICTDSKHQSISSTISCCLLHKLGWLL